MSVTFMWEAVKDQRSFECGSSSDRDVLERVFQQMPTEFGPEHVEKLEAMHAVGGTSRSIYKDIADAVEKVGRIRVWPEY